MKGFTKFTGLRTKNPTAKFIVSIGGWNAGTTRFSQMMSSAGSRATFVKSVVAFLSKYGFDGIDLDIEYPQAQDKTNLLKLIAEMRAAFKPSWLITMAVSMNSEIMKDAYQLPQLCQ